MTLANLDQALRIEWEKVVKELGGSVGIDELALEFGRRVYQLGKETSGLLNNASPRFGE